MRRTSTHRGRTTSKGQAYNVNHNDRNFLSSKDKHIDTSKSAENIYLVVDGEGKISKLQNGTFHDHELKRYEDLFTKSLYRKNEKAIAQRHPERAKTMQDYLQGSRTAPDEMILQIDKEGNFNDVKAFEEIVRAYIEKHNETYPDIKILDAAIHVDEMSLHCHLRQVYCAPDKDGNMESKQHQCLKNFGYELPEPDEARGQYNNLKIPYSADTRNMWIEICEERGIEVEKEPEKKKYSEHISEIRRQKAVDDLEEAEKKLETGEKILEKQREEVQGNIDTLERQKSEIEANNEQIEADTEKIDENKDTLAEQSEQIALYNDQLRTQDKMIEDKAHKIRLLSEQQDELETSVQREKEAFDTIAKAAADHKPPTIEIGSHEVKDGFMKSHEEIYVKVPCKDVKEAKKLQKEISALYDKQYTNKALNEVVNAKINKADRYLAQKQTEARAMMNEATAKVQDAQDIIDAAMYQAPLYRNMKAEDLKLTPQLTDELLHSAAVKEVVEKTIDVTLEELQKRRMLSPDFDLMQKATLRHSVMQRIKDSFADFADKVKGVILKALSKPIVEKAAAERSSHKQMTHQLVRDNDRTR